MKIKIESIIRTYETVEVEFPLYVAFDYLPDEGCHKGVLRIEDSGKRITVTETLRYHEADGEHTLTVDWVDLDGLGTYLKPKSHTYTVVGKVEFDAAMLVLNTMLGTL